MSQYTICHILYGVQQHYITIIIMKLATFPATAAAAIAVLVAQQLVPRARAQAAEPGTYRWASTGGGWRAMVADMGFANLFQQAGLLSSPQFSAYSGTSGSSWFGTQLFYSDNFFKMTTESTPEELAEFVTRWMDTYLNYTETVGIADGVDDPSTGLTDWFDAIDIILDYKQILLLLENTGTWAGFVEEMLRDASTFSYEDPGFTNVAANSENRVASLRDVDYIAQTALAQQSRNRSLDVLVNLGPNDSERAYAVILPVTYSVSSSSVSGKGEFAIGGVGEVGGGEGEVKTYQGFDRDRIFDYDNYDNYFLYPEVGGSILTRNSLGSSQGSQMMGMMSRGKGMMSRGKVCFVLLFV